jgi:hypothetical protein
MMMNRRALVLVALVTAFGLGGVAMVAQTTRPGETLQLWEYGTEVTRDRTVPAEARGEARRGGATATDAMLNKWGVEGWELVAVTRRDIRIDDTIQTETLYAFKRPSRTVNR